MSLIWPAQRRAPRADAGDERAGELAEDGGHGEPCQRCLMATRGSPPVRRLAPKSSCLAGGSKTLQHGSAIGFLPEAALTRVGAVLNSVWENDVRSSRLVAALFAGATSMLLSANAHSYESLLKQGCSIGEKNKPPVHTECLVRSSMSQGVTYRDAKTPDDRHYIVKTETNNINKWLLNGRHAVNSSDTLSDCFKNSQIEICFFANEIQ
jgi:hypothetical protein